MKSDIIKLPPYTVYNVVHTLTQVMGWGIQQLNVPNTWTITRGEGQTVLVIDTGFTTHADLQGAMILEQSKSFISTEPSIDDYCGHSTHCCGIVGARDNTIGMVGVAPEVKIITCKVLDKQGIGTVEGINAALEYALDIKPSVISMSLGGPHYNQKMRELVRALYDANIPIVAAAGNEGPNNYSISYPGKFPEVICVGAFDSDGNPAQFSSRGEEVTLLAPGVKVYSTWLNNEYAVLDGSSMATPFITGIICLLLAKHAKQEKETGINDCKTVAQIKEHLIKYTDDQGAIGHDFSWGYGMINPVRLITETDAITGVKQISPICIEQPKGILNCLKKIWNFFF